MDFQPLPEGRIGVTAVVGTVIIIPRRTRSHLLLRFRYDQAMKDLFEAAGFLKRSGQAEIRRLVKTSRGVLDASLRFEVVLRRAASAENGYPRRTSEHESAALGLSVMVGGRAQAIGYGYSGVEVGYAALKPARFVAAISNRFEGRLRAGAFQRPPECPTVMREYGAGASEWISRRSRGSRSSGVVHARSSLGCDQRGRATRCGVVARVLLSSATISVTTSSPPSASCVTSFSSTAPGADLTAFAFAQGDCYVVAQTAEGHQET